MALVVFAYGSGAKAVIVLLSIYHSSIAEDINRRLLMFL